MPASTSCNVVFDGINYTLSVVDMVDKKAFKVIAYASNKLAYSRTYDNDATSITYKLLAESAFTNECVSVLPVDHLTALNITIAPRNVIKLYIEDWNDRTLDVIRKDYESIRVK